MCDPGANYVTSLGFLNLFNINKADCSRRTLRIIKDIKFDIDFQPEFFNIWPGIANFDTSVSF